ncbi:MAG: nucleotidyltransferase family protein, partial [Lachnospiraceae bacterium]|nr:nucleotidyltransferase family protein [Candidatus Equihabitans merdae]
VRTQMALLNGIDLILSYPVRYCTSSAESFASHAVKILNRLHCVDVLAFGSECGDINTLTGIASVLAIEPEHYQASLRSNLKQRFSFPKARSLAMPNFSDILDGPNNILGIEYIKALIREQSDITPYTHHREGASHLDDESIQRLSSAAAVRRALATGNHIPGLDKALPPNTLPILKNDIGIYGITSEQDFSLILADRLWLIDSPRVLANFADVTEDLAQSFLKNRNHFHDFNDFVDRIKTKNITRTHINRALLHLLLGIRKEPEGMPDNLYAHVLGFKKDSEELLGIIKDNTDLPLVMRSSEAPSILSSEALKLFNEEVRVSNLYETVRAQKSGEPFRNVMSKPLIVM